MKYKYKNLKKKVAYCLIAMALLTLATTAWSISAASESTNVQQAQVYLESGGSFQYNPYNKRFEMRAGMQEQAYNFIKKLGG